MHLHNPLSVLVRQVVDRDRSAGTHTSWLAQSWPAQATVTSKVDSSIPPMILLQESYCTAA